MCECSEDCKEYAKRSIQKYPDCVIKRRIRQQKKREENKKTIISYLGGECVDCGMKAAVVDEVMQIGKARFAPMCAFDVEHTNWKKKKQNVGYMSTYSWNRIREELDDGECVLVCRVCHAIRSRNLQLDPEFKKKRAANNRKSWKNQYTESPQALNTTSA